MKYDIGSGRTGRGGDGERRERGGRPGRRGRRRWSGRPGRDERTGGNGPGEALVRIARLAARGGLAVALGALGVVAAGIAFLHVTALAPTSVPLLLVGWVASIGVALALPFAVVRAVNAAFGA